MERYINNNFDVIALPGRDIQELSRRSLVQSEMSVST